MTTTTTTAPQSGLFFPHTYCSFFFQSTSLALLESQLQRSVSNAADYRTVCAISLAGEREPTLRTPRSDVAISGFLWHSAAGDLRRISATKKDRRVEAGQRLFPLPHSLCLQGVKHVTLPKQAAFSPVLQFLCSPCFSCSSSSLLVCRARLSQPSTFLLPVFLFHLLPSALNTRPLHPCVTPLHVVLSPLFLS